MMNRLELLANMAVTATKLWNRDAVAFKGDAEQSPDYVLSEASFEVVARFEEWVKNIHGRGTVVVQINGFGGYIEAAEQLIGVIYNMRRSETKIKLTVGPDGLVSAGHILWYDWRLSPNWIDKMALLYLHQSTTECANDIPFMSENVRACCQHHTCEKGGYDSVLSYRETWVKQYKPIAGLEHKEIVPYVKISDIAGYTWDCDITRTLTKYQDTNHIFPKIDYVEMFRYRTVCKDYVNPNYATVQIQSDMIPAVPQVNLWDKLLEERYEMAFEKKYCKNINYIQERLSYLNAAMLALATGMMDSFPDDHLLEMRNAASEILDLCDMLEANPRKYVNGYYLGGAVEYWFNSQIRRGRPQAPGVLFDFVVALSKVPSGSADEAAEYFYKNIYVPVWGERY